MRDTVEPGADGALGANSIHDLVDMFESWGKVQELSEQISGVRAQLIDARGKVIAGKESLPVFCQLVQSSKLGEHRCHQSYHTHCLSGKAAKADGNFFVCHAGVTNMCFPLRIGRKIVGAVLSGRALGADEKMDAKRYRTMASELGVNADQLIAAARSLNRLKKDEFAVFGKLIKPFIDSLGSTMFRYFTLLEKTESLIDAAKESEELLFVDRLTGMFNQRYFEPRLTSEVARAHRYDHPISLVLMELDDFDEQLPEYGHLAKDMIIIEVSRIIEKSARKAEVVVRLDEKRFAIILPESDHDQAKKVAERLRKNVALKRFGEEAGLDIALTMSFGISALLKDVTEEKLVADAESMLQQAKDRGGNRIRVSEIHETLRQAARKTPYAVISKNGHKHRVVITGIGPITPNGIGRKVFWQAIKKGKSGIDYIRTFDTTGLATKIAGQVRDFNAEDFINAKEARRTDRFTQFALAASRLAVEDAGLTMAKLNKERTGVATGTAIGGYVFGANQHAIVITEGPRKINPFLALALTFGASSSQVSIDLGVNGPSVTFSNGCNSGSDAITYAFDLISRGDMDIMLAGGTEAPLMPTVVAAFSMIRALSERNENPSSASRPFDLKRDGFVLGEGAAMLVVEELEHALRRNAKIYAEIVGYGTTCDAYHMTRPEPDGKESSRAMALALENAHVRVDSIDYVNAHGSSTQLNDIAETRAIKKVFGSHASKLSVSSTKSMLGHAVGAPGAIELGVTAMAVKEDFLPPTINYEYPDPDCDLDYVPNIGRESPVNLAISNSFSFGGKNTAIVLAKYIE